MLPTFEALRIKESPPSGFWRSAQGRVKVPSLSKEDHRKMFESLICEYHLHEIQIIEMASLGLSMVLRHSLGYSSHGGHIGFIIDNSFQGRVALATTRHLHCGGAFPTIFVLGGQESDDELFCQLMRTTISLHIPVVKEEEKNFMEGINDMLQSVHHCTLGVSGHLPPYLVDPLFDSVVPLHTILEAPCTSSRNNLNGRKQRVVCATTLSIGSPLDDLLSARDETGTHYLVSVSAPPSLIVGADENYTNLFSLQPIVALEFEEAGKGSM
jgi:hypothetical protein